MYRPTRLSGRNRTSTSPGRAREEALFVRDLELLQQEAERRAIPAGGTGLPERPEVLRVEDVSFTYPGRSAPSLQGVTLEIPRGKVVALVGDNGSGKSTLVKLLCGLYLPERGRILWDGVDTAGLPRQHQEPRTRTGQDAEADGGGGRRMIASTAIVRSAVGTQAATGPATAETRTTPDRVSAIVRRRPHQKIVFSPYGNHL